MCRSRSITYVIFVTISATGRVIGGVLDSLEGKLPYTTWVPYVHSSSLLFWLTCLQETIGAMFGVIMNITTETSVLEFSLEICAQLEILKHRLHRMINLTEEIPEHFFNHTPSKASRLSEHVSHHLFIIRFVKQ